MCIFKNRFWAINCTTIIVPLLLISCASVPDLTERGSMMREISKARSNECEFIKLVHYNDRIDGMGKNRTLMKAIGDTNIRNLSAETGGDSFVVIKSDANVFLGSIAYQAEVYNCNNVDH